MTVVTDPHFNTLLVHEIVGHPAELDRALKYETAYAGRSWFMKDLQDNQIGKQIASPLVSAFSDPLLEGTGGSSTTTKAPLPAGRTSSATECWKSF